MEPPVPGQPIVGVVGNHRRHPESFREGDQPFVRFLLVGDPVPSQFGIKIAAENIIVAPELFLRSLHPAGDIFLRERSPETSAQRDQAIVKLLQELPIHQSTGLTEVVLQPAAIVQPDQVTESLVVPGQQYQVVPIRIVRLDTFPGIVNKVDLATEDRVETDPAAGPVKRITVIKHPRDR